MSEPEALPEALRERQDVAGLILAGGKSRRFGSDKARHVIGQRSMMGHVLATVSLVCAPVLVSLGRDTSPFKSLDVRYVRDRYEDAGPLAGIHAAMEASAAPWLLVVACDMPFVTRAALERLLKGRTPSAQAVVAQDSGGRIHPLCACYRSEIMPIVQAHLASRRLAMHDLVEQLDHVAVVSLPAHALRNINAPDDLKGTGASHQAT